MVKILKWIIREICVLSVIALFAWMYILYKVDSSHDILSTDDAHDQPPSEEYYSAFYWVEWASENWVRDYDFDYSEKLDDFIWEFKEVFSDTMSNIIKNGLSNTDEGMTEYFHAYDSIEEHHFNTTYRMFHSAASMAEDFLTGKLKIREVDTLEYKFLFDFIKDSDILPDLCRKWKAYLTFYDREACSCENGLAYLECCYDILGIKDKKNYYVKFSIL